jgi:8-oxo-dGTP pyrophosphatase MutT (NUDIX family)
MTIATPRPAATIMLVRDGEDGLEVFMTVRHTAIEFASGALVFPGGRVEQADHDIAAEFGVGPLTGNDTLGPGFLVAGIRETFEECGILLARPLGSDALIDADRVDAAAAAHRAAAEDFSDAEDFAGLLRRERLAPAVDLLIPFAHWITPARQRKRYDTLFLLAAAPPDQAGRHDGKEAVDSVWITPERAMADASDGRFKMMFPTHMNLTRLARCRDVAAAIAAARAQPLVTVEPETLSEQDGIREMRIPEAAGYGGSVFKISFPPGIA